MTPDFRRIEVAGHPEWLFGYPGGRQLLVIPALFAEMNRTRRLVADLLRAIAAAGFGAWTLDLPGTGESERPLADVAWDDWREAVAVAGAAIAADATIALRGGALLDDALAGPRWRLSPASGADLLRQLRRADGAGFSLSPAFATALDEATPTGPGRTVRLADDTSPADAYLPGPALWRRAEPGGDRALAEALAADLIGWLG